ncbi:hypothetical protein D9M68_571090 [compost metagenome]
MVVGAPGEGAQAAGDAAHAVDHLVDRFEVAAGGIQRAALEEAHGVAGQRAQRRQRLVEFVGDAGGHLPDHRQLAGLHQAVLGLAQGFLGLAAFADLLTQVLVAGAQIGGALGDPALQLAVGLLQRLAGGEAGGEHLAPLVPGDQQEGQQGEADGGEHAVDHGFAALLGERGEQGEVPWRVDQPAGLRQVGDIRCGGRLRAGEGQGFHVLRQRLAGQRLPFVERPPVVLQAARQAFLVVGAERAHRLEAQGRIAGEDDDAVLVADEGVQAGLLPALLDGVQAHLDHRHADDAPAVHQAVGQVVAGFAGGAADAVEAPRFAPHGVLEIGAERQVLAEVAVGVLPVAGGDHPAGGVEQVDGAAAATPVEAFEVGVDQPAAIGRRVEQQAGDVGFQLQQAGQVGVAADLAFHAAGVQLQLALAVLDQRAGAGADAEQVAAVAEAEGQQDQQQWQQQVAQAARLHGQRWRHGAVWGSALHHSHRGRASPSPGQATDWRACIRCRGHGLFLRKVRSRGFPHPSPGCAPRSRGRGGTTVSV